MKNPLVRCPQRLFRPSAGTFVLAAAAVALLTVHAAFAQVAPPHAPIVINRRRPAARHLSRRRLGIDRRSLLLRALQLHHQEKATAGSLNRRPSPAITSHRVQLATAPSSRCLRTGIRSASRCSTMRAGVVRARLHLSAKEHTRIFLHVARPTILLVLGQWGEGLRARGGYTSFNCDVARRTRSCGATRGARCLTRAKEDNVPTRNRCG